MIHEYEERVGIKVDSGIPEKQAEREAEAELTETQRSRLKLARRQDEKHTDN